MVFPIIKRLLNHMRKTQTVDWISRLKKMSLEDLHCDIQGVIQNYCVLKIILFSAQLSFFHFIKLLVLNYSHVTGKT